MKENLSKNVNISSNKSVKEPIYGDNFSKNKDQTTNSGNKKAKIEEIESIYKALYEKSRNAEFIIKNGIYIDCNQTALEILQYKKKNDLINESLTHFSPTFQADGSKSSEKFQKMMDVALKSGSNRFEWTYTYKYGENFPVEILLTTIKNEPDNKIIVCAWRDISEQKKTEKDLLNKEHRLKETYQMAQIGSFEIDLVKKEVKTSPVFDSIIGAFSKNIDSVFTFWDKLTHPEDREVNAKLMKNALKKNIKFDREYRIITLDKKELKWIHAWCEFFYEDGVAVRFIGAVQDITERKLAENTIRENERLLLETQEVAQLGTFKSNLKNLKFISSPIFDAIHGLKPKGIKTIKRVQNLIHPEDYLEYTNAVKYARENKVKFSHEFRIITEDKKEIKWVIVIGEAQFNNKEPEFFIGTCQDITARKKNELEVKSNQKKLLEIQKITNLGTYEIDLINNTTKTSEIFDKIVDVKTDNDKLSDWWDVVTHPEDTDYNKKLWQKCIKEKKKFIGEYRIKTDDEKVIWVLDMAEIEYKDGVPVKTIGTIQDITERKLNELVLKINEQKLLEVQKIANLGTYEIDLLTNKVTTSEIYNSIIGIKSAPLNNKEWWKSITHPDDYERSEALWQESIEEGKAFNDEYRIITKDKKTKWIHDIAEVQYKNNIPIKIIGTIIDVTELKLKELAIRSNELKLLEIQKIARLGTYDLDLQTQASNTSEIFNEIMGPRPDKFKSLMEWWLHITHPEDQEENQIMWKNCRENHTIFNREYRIISNNKIKWVQGISEIIYDGERPVKTRGTIQDITQRKEAELLLKENEIKLQDAHEITHLGTFIFHPEKNLFESSKIFDEIVGIDATYFKSRELWRKLVHPEDLDRVAYMMNSNSLRSVSEEFRVIRPTDQKIVWIQGNARVNYDQNGQRTTTTGTIQDITARKSNEEALLRADNILNSLDSLVVVCDSSGFINYITPSIEKILGYKSEELLGNNWWNLTYEDPKIAEKTRKSILDYVYNTGELTPEIRSRKIRSKNGEFKTIEWYMSAENKDNFISIGVDVTEKYEKEQQFKTVIEGAYDAIILVNDKGLVIEWNKAAENIFDYKKNEIIGKPFTNLMPKEYLELSVSEFKNAQTKDFIEKYKSKRLLGLKKGKKRFPVEFAVNSWLKDGTYYFCAFIKDITQTVREEKIKKINYEIVKYAQNSKNLAELLPFIKTALNSVINTSNFFVALYDEEEETFSVPFREDSELAESALGTEDFNKGQSFSGYIIERKKPLLSTRPYIKSLEKKGQLYERGIKSKCWLGVPLITEEKAIGVLVVQSYTDKNAYSEQDVAVLELIATNISNAIKKTQDIEKINLLNEALIQTPAIIMITNSDGLLDYVNPAFTKITGYTMQEVLGKNPTFLNPDVNKKEFYKGIWGVIVKGGYWQGEFVNITKDGSSINVAASISPVRNVEGNITQYVVVEEDITEKRKLQRQFLNAFLEAQETEKYAFGQELHDGISQILSTEGMYINLLVNKNKEAEKEADKEEAKFLNKIKELNLRAINETRNIAHGLMSSQLTQSGLLIAIDHICEENSSAKNIKYHFINTGVEEAEISQENKNSLYRIIQELSTNINRYSRATKATISLGKLNKHNLKLEVKDNGIGLDIKIVKDKINGTGLLNVERRVTFLQGKLDVKSTPKKGTCFSIIVPI